MKAHERAYLLMCAAFTRNAAEKAREAGEEFHLVGGFSLLEGDIPIRARAQWDDSTDRLVLRLRFNSQPKPSDRRLNEVAAFFFNGKEHVAMPTIELLEQGCFERAYYIDASALAGS